MKDQHRDVSTTCRTCLKVADTHSGLIPGNTPDDGDVAICHGCGTISIFIKTPLGYVLRAPTDAEAADIDADETIREVRRLQALGGRADSLVRTWRRTAPREDPD